MTTGQGAPVRRLVDPGAIISESRITLAIVVALSVVAIEGTAGMVWIGVIGKEIPTALVGIVASACGALGGALMAPALHAASRMNGAKKDA